MDNIKGYIVSIDEHNQIVALISNQGMPFFIDLFSVAFEPRIGDFVSADDDPLHENGLIPSQHRRLRNVVLVTRLDFSA